MPSQSSMDLQAQKTFESFNTHALQDHTFLEIKRRGALPFCFSSNTVRVSFLLHSYCHIFLFFAFCAFCWWFHRLKCPRHSVAILSSVPEHGTLVGLPENTHHTLADFIQARVIVPLAMSLMLMNQRYVSNKASLTDRHTKQGDALTG